MTKPKPKRVALDAHGRVVLTPQLAETIVRLAWQPEGRQFLREALAAGYAAPDPAGLKRAIEVVHRAVPITPPHKDVGRKAVRKERSFVAWIMFHYALGKRRLVEPSFGKEAMIEEFVARSRAGKGFWHDGLRAVGHEGSKRLPSGAKTLTSVGQFKGWLKEAEKSVKGRREKNLRHYLRADVYAALHGGK